ncbi:MAG: hypothetical protein NZL92_05680 [Gloeomargarita sp. SKYG116]|nr:hypothetical protein [Gloeomargarita sp. SKYG116]MCS7226812.1 hypothetical protein [Gloeomargarita sp. SKYB31]MDW8401167.1 hypothetical protein [Gloeomargarita sp. SKYGB_i_bin116]
MTKVGHLYVAISDHGLGHVTRTLAIVAEVRQRRPELRITLATASSPTDLEAYLSPPFTHRSVSLDVGVVQKDSLTQDLAATRQALEMLLDQADASITQEVDYIRSTGVDLIFADIPSLAGLIAERAGIPCVMSGNFGWDFIYRQWGGAFVALADHYAQGYRYCHHLFRVPFCETMSSFPRVTDVGLTGQWPRFAPDTIREKLEIAAPPERTVLLAFGGFGLQKIPYDAISQFSDWCFLVFDPSAPPLPNVRRCHTLPYRPVDLMPLCGKVVTKPGYSTYSEAYRLGLPIYSLERRGFAEADLLLQGLQRYCHHRIITSVEFHAHPWEFLTLDPYPPQTNDRLATDGNQTIAEALLDYLGSGGNCR